MGISVIASYRGGYNFEAIGLSRALVAEFFPGMQSRISGIGLSGLARNVLTLHKAAWSEDAVTLPVGGLYKMRVKGEVHAFDGGLIHTLQTAVATDSFTTYKRYADAVRRQKPVALRDLLDFREGRTPIPVEDVESITEIRKRLLAPGISLGALSPEAHETLSIAMNRIGARSDSGEGGEDPSRSKPRANGDNASSAIKQIASGRFGVTAQYLNDCREIEIKMAQGAKPGEGGQLPGFKVTGLIAKLRHATEGVTLISPPPHHDIYSIEDLAQLIYDLKQINPEATVTVKLVARSGIGTIAAGVAKARADAILISGHSGGTGASPQTSVKYAGLPWEMGLAEAHQVLMLNRLRHRVKLRTDGGLKTGRDVVIAAMLGAEEFGIGTASLVAMGCIMVRQCHSNTCPVGVCTQDEALRKKVRRQPGEGDQPVLLHRRGRAQHPGLARLLVDEPDHRPHRPAAPGQPRRGLSRRPRSEPAARPGRSGTACALLHARGPQRGAGNARCADDRGFEAAVRARREDAAALQRAEHASRHRHQDLQQDRAALRHGDAQCGSPDRAPARIGGTVAGRVRGPRAQARGDRGCQRLCRQGPLRRHHRGAPGTVLAADQQRERDHRQHRAVWRDRAGSLYAAGQAGERFAVRNSGAVAVVEGCGSNGCEYMTGGTVVILGPVGDNFGAGFTGGTAFVYDKRGDFELRVNADTLGWERVVDAAVEAELRALIEAHARETSSRFAALLLHEWSEAMPHFWHVVPKEYAKGAGPGSVAEAGVCGRSRRLARPTWARALAACAGSLDTSRRCLY